MTKNGIISVQLDKPLRRALEVRREQMTSELGRAVRDAELVRVLLRHGLGGGGALADGAYVEGWRAGMTQAREAFERGIEAASTLRPTDT